LVSLTEDKLNVGIIGLGVGNKHIEGFLQHPACEVRSLCDFDEAKLREVGSKYPEMKLCSDAEDIINDDVIDIVSVASYDNCHYEQVSGAIKTGKHIFVEKPLCLYPWQARKIRKLLNSKPELKLSSNLILRKSERFCDLKRRLAGGELGEVYSMYGSYDYGRIHKITEGWRGSIDFYSVVYGGAVHILDLMLWLSGKKVVEAAAYGTDIPTKDSQFKYDDTNMAVLKFDDGSVAGVTSNFSCVRPHFHQLQIYGTAGTFVNDAGCGRLYRSREGGDYERLETEYPGVHKGDLIYSFVDSILGKAEAEVTSEDVFDVMSVCFAIENAAKKSKSQKVKYI
jgi:predicted dehydrogenase